MKQALETIVDRLRAWIDHHDHMMRHCGNKCEEERHRNQRNNYAALVALATHALNKNPKPRLIDSLGEISKGINS